MKKNLMFKYAHKIAKGIVATVQNYSIAFGMALKYVWRQVKKNGRKIMNSNKIDYAIYYLSSNKKQIDYDHSVLGVPEWLINKNLMFDQNESYAVRNECNSISLVKETEKAKDICFHTEYGNVFMWAPKSVLLGEAADL